MTNKPTTIHKIPLLLAFDNDAELDVSCAVPTIKVENEGAVLRLVHQSPEPKRTKHQYCYTLAVPPATDEYVYYLSVFSGPGPEEMKPWVQEKGVSQSPLFDLAPGEVEHYVSVVVQAEPRAGTKKAREGVNPRSSKPIAAPKTYTARKHVKSDFQGGDDEQ